MNKKLTKQWLHKQCFTKTHGKHEDLNTHMDWGPANHALLSMDNIGLPAGEQQSWIFQHA